MSGPVLLITPSNASGCTRKTTHHVPYFDRRLGDRSLSFVIGPSFLPVWGCIAKGIGSTNSKNGEHQSVF
jgi:hypothetical protein